MGNVSITFSQSTLRYFMIQFGLKLINEYTEDDIDLEDLCVVEQVCKDEIWLLLRSFQQE